MTRAMTSATRFLALALLAAACTVVAPLEANATTSTRHAAKSCWSGYSYNGVQSPARGYGVSAELTLAGRSSVGNGHVAAWIGVGGAGLGPGGSDEWVQAGIAEDAGGADMMYVEYKRPGDARATYAPLWQVSPGETHTIVVYERAAQQGSWRVMVDGVKVSDPIMLPGSHGLFQPVATAENWDGGVAGSCNQYAFSFSNLAVRTQFAGGWHAFDLSRVLRDPAYQLALRPSGFLASSR
jgi:hypothetical protein